MAQDFWQSSGYATLSRNDHGWLRVTPDYLRFILQRPELAPIAESGPRERALHAGLMDDPLRALAATDLEGIEDADARANYIHFLKLRKSLLDAVTLERFYLQSFRKGIVDTPPAFLDMAAHAITRSLLEECADPYELRAGEMFFRRQRVSTEGGQVLAADAETIRMFAETGGFGSVGRLIARQGTPLASVNMDVMSHENAQLYWLRESRYAWLLDLTRGRAGEQALSRLMSRWVKHFLGVEVAIESLANIEDDAWRWHLGLDVEASAILNDLYEGREVDEERRQRLIALFRLSFIDARDMRVDVAGKPVYLGMAINGENVLKFKPQNLLLNLPLSPAR
jgi:hypothetical protein